MTRKKPVERPQGSTPRKEQNLDSRYGEIGISAVVAALPYQSKAKKPADAPVNQEFDTRNANLAA